MKEAFLIWIRLCRVVKTVMRGRGYEELSTFVLMGVWSGRLLDIGIVDVTDRKYMYNESSVQTSKPPGNKASSFGWPNAGTFLGL